MNKMGYFLRSETFFDIILMVASIGFLVFVVTNKILHSLAQLSTPHWTSSLFEKQLQLGEVTFAFNDNGKNDFFTRYGLERRLAFRFSPAPLSDPWPLPQVFRGSQRLYEIDPATVKFEIANVGIFLLKGRDNIAETCSTLLEIIERYRNCLLFESARPAAIIDATLDPGALYVNATTTEFWPYFLNITSRPVKWRRIANVVIATISIAVMDSCTEHPSSDSSSESYALTVDSSQISITADDIWGVQWAFETLSQLIFQEPPSDDDPERRTRFFVRGAKIKDFPRFKHRGILLDSARHFLPKEIIMRNIDAMVQNKFNVLHWHLTDDQSFPLQLNSFPDLARLAAFSPDEIYTAADVDEIVEYARLRGVRIMPELDSPGHVFSWRHLPVDIVTRCHDQRGKITGDLGPLDPTNELTYNVLEKIYSDILQLFPDASLIHAGGDEVPLGCWLSNPAIDGFYRRLPKEPPRRPTNNTITNWAFFLAANVDPASKRLMKMYNKRLVSIIEKTTLMSKNQQRKRNNNDSQIVMWEDAFRNDPDISKNVTCHVWQSSQETVRLLVNSGFKVIFSTCWYLDLINYGVDWVAYYQCDPAMLRGQVLVKNDQNILGGEAAIWGEYVDEHNIFSRLWPRASAVAERLWSSSSVVDVNYASRRLEEHRCRMIMRSIPAAPVSGPGTCNNNYGLFRSAADIAMEKTSFFDEADDNRRKKHYSDKRQIFYHNNNNVMPANRKLFGRQQQNERNGNFRNSDCILLVVLATSNNRFRQLCIDSTFIYVTVTLSLTLTVAYALIRQGVHRLLRLTRLKPGKTSLRFAIISPPQSKFL